MVPVGETPFAFFQFSTPKSRYCLLGCSVFVRSILGLTIVFLSILVFVVIQEVKYISIYTVISISRITI